MYGEKTSFHLALLRVFLYTLLIVDTIEELIEKSDRIIVLSPDNPEMHLELTEKALQSGKLVYVDKTFAPDKETAIKIFENAKAHNTKCFRALR